MSLIAQAAEDAEGFIEHNGDVLDIFLLVATILFAIAFVIRLTIKPVPIDGLVITGGFTALAFALLFL